MTTTHATSTTRSRHRPKGVRARQITHHIRKEEQLNLAYGHLKEEDCPTISEALNKTRRLTLLDLRGNDRVGDDGAKLLAEGLRTNRTVATMDLSDCHIGDEGFGCICEALKVNKTLHTLLLGLNPEITHVGAAKLGEALQHNKTLRAVSLYRCNIGDEGASHLAESLARNSTLESLTLFNNNIGNDGAQKLLDSLNQNDTLQKLELRCNPIENGMVEQIARLVQLNKDSKSAKEEKAKEGGGDRTVGP